MRIMIEGPYSRDELSRIVSLLKELDQAHPSQVQSLVVEDHNFTAEEWVNFCQDMGLPEISVLNPYTEDVRWFETGGGFRLVPIQQDEQR